MPDLVYRLFEDEREGMGDPGRLLGYGDGGKDGSTRAGK